MQRLEVAQEIILMPVETTKLRERFTEPWRRHGRAGYMAPEQVKAFEDKPGIKNDLYSLAVIAVELLTGNILFDNGEDPNTIINRQLAVQHPSNLESWVLERFNNQFCWFLVADPQKRPINTKEFQEALFISLGDFL